MYDIITFGSASWDIFIKPRSFCKIFDKKKFITGDGICFDLGSKVDIDDIYFCSGGGGTNTAATFSKQGFKVSYCGMIGDDVSGNEIINELKQFNIDTQFIYKTKKSKTNHSIAISGIENEDRTMLVYRGASEFLKKKDIPFNKLKAKWFYLAPLSGNLSKIFELLVNFAYKNNIKIAVNPGNTQLSFPLEKLKKILKKVDILILNQEEASFLTKIPYEKEKEILKKIREISNGLIIITKGSEGVSVLNDKYLYKAKTFNTKVIDKTGAGDSFSSGFISGFISKNNIEYAIQLGSANATSCLQKWGAKNGLLSKNDKFKKIKVEKIKFN